MYLKDRYGSVALVAGASEGIGAAFSELFAQAGLNLVLIARREKPLTEFSNKLSKKYRIEVQPIVCDLSSSDASDRILQELNGKIVNIFTYNAALSFIGPFEDNGLADHEKLVQVNVATPLKLVYNLGQQMLKDKKGAVILMSSMAGFQGSGFLSAYAATKAYNRVLAESLWYEWKNKGVDVIACCAGATASPNYIKTKPKQKVAFAPPVQTPENVVEECLKQLGNKPSLITGRGNRIASFFMQRVLPRKLAIKIMGDNTRKMYDV